jgi:hypothetical protein
VVSFFTICTNAQTIYWQLQPREYSSIERIGKGLYKVVSGNKVGVINRLGEMVVPIEYDGVEPFYEDLAPVINKEGTREVIVGVLEKSGRFNRFNDKYYAIANQKFYSEGLLTVSDNRRKLGYINSLGERICGFESNISYVKPFVEGYAAIFRGKNLYQLITPQGEACQIVLGISEIYGGTNMYNGKAVVWDTNGKVFEYSPATRQVNRIKQPSSMDYDYLFRFKAITKMSDKIPYQEVEGGNVGLSPSIENGKYGFGSLLPAQFSSATPFVDDISIVQFNGKYGLLRYSASSSPVSVSVEKPELTYRPSQKANCQFKLYIPQEWNSSDLQVSVSDSSNGENINASNRNGLCTFEVAPNGKSQSFGIEVRSGQLTLWKGNVNYTFKKVDPIKNTNVTLRLINDKANSDDKCLVECTIANPNDDELTTVVILNGSNGFESKTQTVKIAPHSSVKVSSYFLVKKIMQNQSVTVTTDKGGSAKLTGLDLIPFNIDG